MENRKPTEAELEEVFNFTDKSIDDVDAEYLIDAGEYALEVNDFSGRQFTEVTEENMKEGRTLGERIPWVKWTLRHKRDKNGKVDLPLIGRTYEIFKFDLRREDVRKECADLYRAFGYEGAYKPQFIKEEFVTGSGKNTSRRSASFYISKYKDSQTKQERNGRPKIVNPNSKTKKQEKADAKGPMEL